VKYRAPREPFLRLEFTVDVVSASKSGRLLETSSIPSLNTTNGNKGPKVSVLGTAESVVPRPVISFYFSLYMSH
jgi:hypothetical protein